MVETTSLSYCEFKKACQQKSIVFCCVGIDNTKYEVYEHISNLGINVIVLDNPDSKLANRLREADHATYLTLDMASRPTLVTEAVELIRDHIEKNSLTLTGITTLWDDAVSLCARLCHAFQVCGNPVEAVDIAHDKSASRMLLERLGYAGPKSVVLSSEADAKAALHQIPFPAIMKPLYGAASIGVMKVETLEDTLPTYQKIQSTLAEIYATGELMGLTFDDSSPDIGKGEASLTQIVMEEFITGSEFDCDIVMLNGRVVYCNLMDDWAFEPPHFIEIGSSCPSNRPDKMQSEVKEFSQRVLRAMGFTTGVFHVEVIHCEKYGPCLIEVNPRMGGGPVRAIHRSVYGVDLVDYVICACLGLEMECESKTKLDKTAVSLNLFAQKSGTLQKPISKCLQYLDGREDLVSAVPSGEAGDEVIGWWDGFPTAFGRVNFLLNDEAESAIAYCKNLIKDFYHEVEMSTI